MVARQSSYSAKIGKAVNGGKATTSPCKEDVYIANEDIAIGVAVRSVSNKNGYVQDGVLPATGGTTPFHPTDFLGISILPPRGEYNQLIGASGAPSANPLNYPTGDNVRVATEGDYWVPVSGAVSAGDAVTVTPGSGKLGTGTPGAANPVIPHAVWRSDAAAENDLAIVRLSGFIS